MRIFSLEAGEGGLGANIAKAYGTDLSLFEDRAFEDGERKIRPLAPVRGQNVYIIESLAGGDGQSVNDKLIHLLLFIATCREHGAERTTALVPYLAYARKDRQTKPFDPVSLRYVAQMFEAVGVDVVVALDVHNLAAFQNAFRCNTVHLETTDLFAAEILTHAGNDDLAVVAPDAGATKRALALKLALENRGRADVQLALLEKHRSAGVVSGDIFAGEVDGRTVVIYDDMISSGTTMVRAARACRERGARRVLACATHGVFAPDPSALLGAIDTILVTDSTSRACTVAAQWPKRIELVSCAPSLAHAIEMLEGRAG